ncbi:prolactin-2C2-like [Meriones unguiculatus]|uniref:prolactin-2C2-like n=1 Tax=Meriones unguiculatus TaxID=10047 RepID=UPI000B4EEC15|nr:prolactin-2C2-like [Meriones unguiculatus]
MQLSLTQLPSRTLLLLLLSNLLLWENVASVPMCAARNGRCFVSLEDMFYFAGTFSHEVSVEISTLFSLFYAVLLKSVNTLLIAWEHPLEHLVSTISTLRNIPAAIISKARRVKEKNTSLHQGFNSIISLVLRGDEKEEKYPTWSGLASLQSKNEDARIWAFYNMIRCLDNDFKKIDINLNALK